MLACCDRTITFVRKSCPPRLKNCLQVGQAWTELPGLSGEPGIYSARYSDPGATDQSNNEKLLSEIQTRCPQNRQAYYVCTIALADPAGTIHIEAEGQCWGRIIDNHRGSAGFGYDPLFEIPEYHQTFAELGNSVKSVLSHRARALERFVAQLRSKFTFTSQPSGQ